MKRYILGVALGALCPLLGMAQQSICVVKGNVAYGYNASDVGLMTYTGGNTVTISGNDYNLSEIDRLEVRNVEVEEGCVTVQYLGTTAQVTMDPALEGYITAEISGANVTLNQSSEVGDKTTGEITYILQGSSDEGSLVLNGSYKCGIELQGITLFNPSGYALDIENGKRIELSAKNGFVNTLKSGTGKQKSAVYCKGHLELKGKGTLNVASESGHAISAKEYVEMKNLTLNITGAEKDGINCTQYLLIDSGTLNIEGVDGDGIQVDFKDSSNRDEEDTGSITIAGGTVNIADITGSACKGLKCEGDFLMTKGTLTINSSAPGEWDSDKAKTKASACIGADGDVGIIGGDLILTASGGGGKGISGGGNFTMEGGSLTITTAGGVLAYSGGTLSQNYTGNTDRLDSDAKSSPKGMKIDGNVDIVDGTIFVTASGNGGEGIESKSELTISGGKVTVRAKDDAINSSSHMYIRGGEIDVISTDNDGLDSNGDMYFYGGVTMAFGAGSPECGIDANHEEGYSVYFYGGRLLAVGGSNETPTKSGSTQPYVNVSAKVEADTEVSISAGSDTLYTFTTPSDLTSVNLGGGFGPGRPGGIGNGSSVLISVPGLTQGSSYTVKVGTSTATGTASLQGSSSGPRW